jgi:lambda repressor-like predicted transcriptional regulator
MPLRKKINCLRELRRKTGYSGYDLQILTSIPAQEIYRIERGLKMPFPYEKALIAKALNLPGEIIFPKGMQRNNEILEE